MEQSGENIRAESAKHGSPFLDTKQAGQFLALSHRTLENMRSEGTGPRYRKHGRIVRYHIDELIAWSKEQTANLPE